MIRIEAQRNICEQNIGLYIMSVDTTEKRTYASGPVIMVQKSEGELFDPALKLTYLEAQYLLDSLIRTGIKPSNYKDETKEVSRLEDHLKDMQKLYNLHLKQIENEVNNE